MKTHQPDASSSTPEQDFRLRVALEVATLHAKATKDSRLRAAIEKLRQARDEITALKAEKRTLAREVARLTRLVKDRGVCTLTGEEQAARLREIFKVGTEYQPAGTKVCQEAERESPGAH